MTFEGFVPPTKNYFPMPNDWIDICAEINNLAELKVIQYVLRHTWGFHEYGITKTITVEEFMHGRKHHDGTRIDNGTGLKSDRSVKDGIKAAIRHGYLIYEVDATDLARIKKSYALKMLQADGYILPPDAGQVDTTPQNEEIGQVVSTPLVGNIYPSEGQHLPLGGSTSTPRSEKDTLERHLEKNTEERQVPSNVSYFETEAKKRITAGRLKVVSDSHERLSEEERAACLAETKPRLEAVTLKGQTDGTTHHHRSDTRSAPPPLRPAPAEEVLTLQQKPGEGVPLPPVAVTPLGDRSDTVPVQAIPVCVGDAGPQSVPPGGAAPASDASVHKTEAVAHLSGNGKTGLKITHAPTSKPLVQERFSLKESAPIMRPPTLAQAQRQVERRRDEILALYAREIGRKPSRSKANMDGATMLAQDDVSDEDICMTIKAILADSFLVKNLSMSFVYKELDALARKGSPPPLLPPAKKPSYDVPVFTEAVYERLRTEAL